MSRYVTLGQRIRFARVHENPRTLKAFGEAVAQREGRSKPYDAMTVSRWERNLVIPPLPAISAIATEGAVSRQWLTFDEGEPTSNAKA